MTNVTFDHFSRIHAKGWHTRKPIPIFLNMNIDHPIGECKLIIRAHPHTGDDLFFGEITLHQPIDENLYFYYLKDVGDDRSLFFRGINFSSKKLRHTYTKKKPPYAHLYRILIQHTVLQFKDIIIIDIPDNAPDNEAPVIPMF